MFNLTTQSKIYLHETIKFKKLWLLWNRSWGRFTRKWLTVFLPTYQRQNFYMEDFVYILVICEARSVRSSGVLKYQLECDKVQWLQTHCGQTWISLGRLLYKDILFLCPRWSSGPYISRNFLIWTHFVNASWKKSDLRMHISSTTQGN